METDVGKRRELVRRLREFRGSLPANFKFDREEANARGSNPDEKNGDAAGPDPAKE